jgi:hypothetical protein
MPFTFSHPAILIPLRVLPKNLFSITGLVIGSLIPDFEYFLRLKLKSDHSHTLSGIFWFDLPVSLFFCFIFHLIVRKQLIDNLPDFFKSRLWKFRDLNWVSYFFKNWYIVILSIFIGVLSHIFWDSFTHEDGFFVDRINLLNGKLLLLNHEFHTYKVLQQLSTLFGGLSIFIFVFRLSKTNSYSKINIIPFWLVFFSLLITSFLTFTTIQNDLVKVGHKIVILISSSLLSLIFTTLIFKIKKFYFSL